MSLCDPCRLTVVPLADLLFFCFKGKSPPSNCWVNCQDVWHRLLCCAVFTDKNLKEKKKVLDVLEFGAKYGCRFTLWANDGNHSRCHILQNSLGQSEGHVLAATAWVLCRNSGFLQQNPDARDEE